MHRTDCFIVAVFLLAGGAIQTPCDGEKPSLKASPPEIVSAPDKWLDLVMAAPRLMAVRPDGRAVVVSAGCETILYDVQTGSKLHAWNERFSSASFSHDGRFLLTMQSDNVAVWDCETFAEAQLFIQQRPAWNEPGYRSYTSGAALSHDGTHVAIANRLGSYQREKPDAVYVYDIRSGQLCLTLPTPENTQVDSIKFLPNRPRLLVRRSSWRKGEQGQVFYRLWDVEQQEPICEFGLGVIARVSPDGRWIVSGGLTRSPYKVGGPPAVKSIDLTVRETTTGSVVRTLVPPHPMRDFTFSPNGERILAALQTSKKRDGKLAFEGRLIDWDVQSGEVTWESEDSQKPYATVAYSPDGGRRFATIEAPNGVDDDVDHWLRGWTTKTGAALPIDDYAFASYNGTEDLFFLSDGSRFIDRSACFDVRDTLTGDSLLTLPEFRWEMSNVAFTPDGTKFFVGSGGTGFLTDCASGNQRKWSLPGTHATFLDDGRTVFTFHYAGLHLIDVVTGKVVCTLTLDGHYQRFDVAVSRDGRRVVVSQEVENDRPSVARLILFETSQPFHPRIVEHYASAVAYHPDGTRFLAASPTSVDEFDAGRGVPTRSLWSPPGRPLAITYSPDGELVLAGGVVGHSHQREPIDRKDQGWATLWDSRTEQTIRLEGHTGPVTAAAFSPDRTRCATGSHDKTIRLWDTSTGRCLCVFRGHLGTIHDIAYSPHGDRLLSAAEDGAAFWNVAAFVASPTKSSPLAGEFNTVEAFKTIYDGSSMSNPTPGTVIPRPPGYEPASFDFRRVTWPVVEIGEVDRKRLPPDIQRWLAQSTARESSAPLPPSDETPEYAKPYRSCGTSRDGRREVLVSRGEKEVVLRDDGGQVLRTWDAGRQYSQAAISPSGKEVAIARDVRTGESQRYEITIYDADTGTAKRVIREDDGRWSGHFRIDPQEKTIMLRMAGSKVVMRDYQTGEHLAELGTHEGGAPRHAEYSPDGRFLISGKYPDPVVAIYNATTLDPVATFPNLFPAWSFSLSPDETRLLVGQRFGRSLELVTMWDVQTTRRLWNRLAPRNGSIDFSPDGQRFLAYGTGSLSECSVFWDAEAGEILCTVLTSRGDRNNRPVLGIDGLSLHLGTAEGPRLWPRDDSPVRSR